MAFPKMSESQHPPEEFSGNGWPQRARSGEEMLPPVEPPPAGFILQLFVIPALIVLVLLAVWQVPKWLVRRTSAQPNELIQRLEQGSSIARFQAAFDLANRLRDGQFAPFRRDPKAASELARILERQVEQAGQAGGMDDDEVRFRTYLARALGEFEVQEGIDALLTAAETNRDPREKIVRDAAVQAIAVRAYNLQQLKPPQELESPKLEPAFARLAADDDAVIRSQAAFALGKIGTPWSIALLEKMVGDPHADTRYNAAVGLAVRGDAKAVPMLAEMLALEDLPSAQEELTDQDRLNKRAIIVTNAVNATQELAKANATADFAPIVEALEAIVNADAAALTKARIPAAVVPKARAVLKELRERTPTAERENAFR
jgi:HEAT repeat protein